MITIGLMGVATIAVGFLPTYAQIGIWAPILLVMLRLVQGLSAGGEIGGGAVYLTEHAGNSYRGFKTSFLQLMGPLGILASTIQISILQNHLTAEQFLTWGWRAPFWVSLFLLIITFYTRKSIEETPVFLELTKQGQTESQLLNNFKDKEIRKRMFLSFICVSASGAILFFCVQIYTAIFLKTSTKLESTLVDQLSIIMTLILFPLTIYAGWLSDKYGRKPIVLSGIIVGALGILPGFQAMQILANTFLLSSNPEIELIFIILVLCVFSLALALVIGPQSALLAELFSAKNRNSAATLPHNFAAGWVGGLLPLAVTWINQKWGGVTIGLWYPTFLLAIAALLAIIYLPETYKNSLSN
jgi:MFS family permease